MGVYTRANSNSARTIMTTHLTVGRRSTGPRLVAPCLLVGLLLATTSGRGQVMAVNGMVVSSHPMATEAGLLILPAGREPIRRGRRRSRNARRRRTADVGARRCRRIRAHLRQQETAGTRSLDFIGAAPAATKPELFTAGARLWDRAHPRPRQLRRAGRAGKSGGMGSAARSTAR